MNLFIAILLESFAEVVQQEEEVVVVVQEGGGQRRIWEGQRRVR